MAYTNSFEIPDAFDCYSASGGRRFNLRLLSGNDLYHRLRNHGADFRVCRKGSQPTWEHHPQSHEVRFESAQHLSRVLQLFAETPLGKSIQCVYRTKDQVRVILPFEEVEELVFECQNLGLKYIAVLSVQGTLEYKARQSRSHRGRGRQL